MESQWNRVIEYVQPYYEGKDIMHDLSHIDRVIKSSEKIVRQYDARVNRDYIRYGAYFHGVIKTDPEAFNNYFEDLFFDKSEINRLFEITMSSHSDMVPQSLEGKVLHDAHILEGETSFYFLKCIITGSYRQQTLQETIDIIENNVIGKSVCYLQENIIELSKREMQARILLDDLKKSI
jgi:uncharacterized protein